MQLIPALLRCVTGLSIDFDEGKLYWISSGNSTINRCNLDGTGLEIIDGVKGRLTRATALTIMGEYLGVFFCYQRLYSLIFFLLLETNSVFPGDKLWWADQGTDQVGTCDKKDGGNWKVLRNGTSPVMHMRIYNETIQQKGNRVTWFTFSAFGVAAK